MRYALPLAMVCRSESDQFCARPQHQAKLRLPLRPGSCVESSPWSVPGARKVVVLGLSFAGKTRRVRKAGRQDSGAPLR